jgi:5-methylcytosine-specific restriction protein B
VEQIKRVMRFKVIPLLIEYFYEDWEKVRAVLNETTDEGGFIFRRQHGPASAKHDLGERECWRYGLREPFAEGALAQLLQ